MNAEKKRDNPLARYIIPARGPVRMRMSGGGLHAQGVRRKRTRSDARRDAIRRAQED